MTETEPPRPAATLIVFRHARGGGSPQVLMQVRAAEMRFAAGACVFPGGAVDPADAALAETLPAPAGWDGLPDLTARIAAIREMLEETGLAIGLKREDGQPIDAEQAARARALLGQHKALHPVLEEMGWQIDAAALTPFARWCPRFARPFDTRFYLADLGTGAVDVSHEAHESQQLLWLSPSEVLAQAEAGALSVIFPTRRNLERLARFASFEEVRAHALASPLDTITPSIVEREGTAWLTIPEGMGYPVTEERLETAKRG
ncbi:NUDIX hydrolase [Novosphingobium terrae]|uniref:NUDIX hydrolase n=1 Tax=Novosphingobium terrae TaxID=2726189 RepID=UPI001980C52B|nr:NUDIX domain-containing protein [Novosphingobium terrae]